jgi:hypothetical protein
LKLAPKVVEPTAVGASWTVFMCLFEIGQNGAEVGERHLNVVQRRQRHAGIEFGRDVDVALMDSSPPCTIEPIAQGPVGRKRTPNICETSKSTRNTFESVDVVSGLENETSTYAGC